MHLPSVFALPLPRAVLGAYLLTVLLYKLSLSSPALQFGEPSLHQPRLLLVAPPNPARHHCTVAITGGAADLFDPDIGRQIHK